MAKLPIFFLVYASVLVGTSAHSFTALTTVSGSCSWDQVNQTIRINNGSVCDMTQGGTGCVRVTNSTGNNLMAPGQESGTGNANFSAFLANSGVTQAACCVSVTWYQDADGDGFGNPSVTTSACSQPGGYVSNNSDCCDNTNLVHPSAGFTATSISGSGITGCSPPGGDWDWNCSGTVEKSSTTTHMRNGGGTATYTHAGFGTTCSFPATVTYYSSMTAAPTGNACGSTYANPCYLPTYSYAGNGPTGTPFTCMNNLSTSCAQYTAGTAYILCR